LFLKSSIKISIILSHERKGREKKGEEDTGGRHGSANTYPFLTKHFRMRKGEGSISLNNNNFVMKIYISFQHWENKGKGRGDTGSLFAYAVEKGECGHAPPSPFSPLFPFQGEGGKKGGRWKKKRIESHYSLHSYLSYPHFFLQCQTKEKKKEREKQTWGSQLPGSLFTHSSFPLREEKKKRQSIGDHLPLLHLIIRSPTREKRGRRETRTNFSC